MASQPLAEPMAPVPCTPVPCKPVPCMPPAQERINALKVRAERAKLVAERKESGAPPLFPRPHVNSHGPSLNSTANRGGRRTRKHRKHRGRRGSMKR